MTRPTLYNAERIYFSDEVKFFCYVSFCAGALFTCVAAYVWSWFL